MIIRTLQNYLEVTKPRIWILLVLTAIGGFTIAIEGDIPWITGLVVITAVTLGSAASNTLTNYIDRDIDAVMYRTRLRPLPTRRIYPASRALYFGGTLAALALLLTATLNLLSTVLMFLGIVDNVIIYSRIFKRRNPLNIILGGFSGGMPVLIGYAAVRDEISLLALFIAGLVMVWIPTHIWSLALHSKEDYSKVNVPMLPVIVRENVAIRIISMSTVVMVLFSLLAPLFSELGWIYLLSAIFLGTFMLILSTWLIIKPSNEIFWISYKVSSPYLGIIFLTLIVDSILSIPIK